MLITFQKIKPMRITLSSGTTARQFDWAKVARVVLMGGCTRPRAKSRLDLRESMIDSVLFTHSETWDYELPEYRFRHRETKATDSPYIVDIIYQKEYVIMQELRNHYKIKPSITIFKKIRALERYLALKHNEEPVPGTRFRPMPPRRMSRFYDNRERFDDKECLHYRKPGLSEIRVARNRSRYLVPFLPDLLAVTAQGANPVLTFSTFFYSNYYNRLNSFNYGFVNPFRLELASQVLDSLSYLESRLIDKYLILGNLLRQVDKVYYEIYKNKTKHRARLLKLGRVRFGYPERVQFCDLLETMKPIYFSNFYRLQNIASSNVSYLTSKYDEVSSNLKIDVENFLDPSTKEGQLYKAVKDQYNEFKKLNKPPVLSKYLILNIGLIKSMYPFVFLKKLVRYYREYSFIPTSKENNTMLPNKTRKKLKDTVWGYEELKVRVELSNYIKGLIFPEPIERDCNRPDLLAVVAKFLNYNSRVDSYTDNDYEGKDDFLHNFFTTQGVIYEYWNEHTNQGLPGQLSMVMQLNRRACLEVNMLLALVDDKLRYKLPNSKVYNDDLKALLPDEDLIINKVKLRRGLFSRTLSSLFIKIDYYLYWPKVLVLYVFSHSSKGTLWAFQIITALYEAIYGFCLYSYLLAMDIETELSTFYNNSNLVKRLRFIRLMWDSTTYAEDIIHDFSVIDSHPDYVVEEGLNPLSEEDEDKEENYNTDPEAESDVELDDPELIDSTVIVGEAAEYSASLDRFFADEFFNFWDEMEEIFFVDLPHLARFVLNPIIDFVLRYPLWSLIELYTLLLLQVRLSFAESYYNFLNIEKPSFLLRMLQRFVIVCKWLLKIQLAAIYIVLGLLTFEEADFQVIVVYSFELMTREFYYVSYIAFLIGSAAYFFGPPSLRDFIRYEVGLENFIFILTLSGVSDIEMYEPTAMPLPPRQRHLDLAMRNTGEPLEDTVPPMGFDDSSMGHRRFTGDSLAQHFVREDLEFIVENQLWGDVEQHPYYHYAQEYLGQHLEFYSPEIDREEYNFEVNEYINNLDPKFTYNHLTSLKFTKNPETWNNSGSFVYDPLANSVSMVSAYSPEVDRAIKYVPDIMEYTPGKNDLQANRFHKRYDPANTGSSITDV